MTELQIQPLSMNDVLPNGKVAEASKVAQVGGSNKLHQPCCTAEAERGGGWRTKGLFSAFQRLCSEVSRSAVFNWRNWLNAWLTKMAFRFMLIKLA
jgi:hypothetical protein